MSTCTIAAIICSTHVFGNAYDAVLHGPWPPPETLKTFKKAYFAYYADIDKDKFQMVVS